MEALVVGFSTATVGLALLMLLAVGLGMAWQAVCEEATALASWTRKWWHQLRAP